MSSQSPDALMTDLWAILRHTLASFAYNRFSAVHPDNFSAMMENHLNGNQTARIAKEENPLVFEQRADFAKGMDIHSTLHLIDKGWSDTFGDYPDSMREDFLFILEKRNVWAHQGPLSIEDVDAVANASRRVLEKIGTPSAKKAIKKIRQLLRHDYYGHIRVAEQYIPRPDMIENIQSVLLQDKPVAVALHGMGGIGKSVLLRALCEEQAVQARFADGILWMTFGSEVAEVQLAQKLREWIKALNGTTHDTDLSLYALKIRLAELLKNQACLLILDDVWTKEQLEAFRVVGVNCRMIFSTRDAEIARETGAKTLSVEVMNDAMAIELLDSWSQGKLASEPERYKELIVESLGNLPLAIKLAGAQLQTKSAKDWLTTFEARKLKSKRPVEHSIHDNLENTFALSFDALKLAERRFYTALAIFPADVIPEQAILRLWEGLGQPDPETSKEFVTDLAARALCDVTTDSVSGVRTISLHPLLKSFLHSDLNATDRQHLHLALLAAYEHSQMGAAWHTVPDDGYFYQHIPFHLKQAGKNDLLRQLLLDYAFIQAKLRANPDVDELYGDYELLRDPLLQLIQHTIQQSELILRNFPEQLAECLYTQLMLLRKHPDIDALLDACYHASNPKLFPIQSPFRVGGVVIQYLPDNEAWMWRFGEPLTEQEQATFKPIHELLPQTLPHLLKDLQERAEEHPPFTADPRPHSYPDGFHSSYHTYMGNMDYGHKIADVNLIALSGDFALSPDNIRTRSAAGEFVTKAVINIFNWKTGDLVNWVYTGEVNALVVAGDFALTASPEGTIKVWHWQTKQEIRTLTKERELFSHLRLGGEFVAAASEKTVTVWNWQTGEEICTFTEDEANFIDFLLFEDVIVFVTTKHVVTVWNWGADSASYRLENSQGAVLSTVLKGEWVFYVLENQSLQIANWRTKTLISTIDSFSGQILEVVAQNMLLTARNNHLCLWNLSTGELITSIYAGELHAPHEDMPDDSIQNALVTPNFERFIVGTQDGRIFFLQPNPALLAILSQ